MSPTTQRSQEAPPRRPKKRRNPPRRKPLPKSPRPLNQRRIPRSPLKNPVAPKPDRVRAEKIFERLARHFPDAKCALDFKNPLQLLIATILSAQSTDKTVNAITPELF